MGHEDALPPHRPNAGYQIGKETAAWARGSGEMRRLRTFPPPERGGSLLLEHSRPVAGSG